MASHFSLLYPHLYTFFFSPCLTEGTLPLTARPLGLSPLLSLSFSRPSFSCIARGGTYSEDRREGGLEKDSVAHPPMSFGRFKPYFGIKPPRGVDGSGWIRAFVDFTTFENHSRAAFTAVKYTYTTSYANKLYESTLKAFFKLWRCVVSLRCATEFISTRNEHPVVVSVPL